MPTNAELRKMYDEEMYADCINWQLSDCERAEMIVEAWAREHPADEDEPLDEMWLRSICEEWGEDGNIVTDDSLNVAICFVGTRDPHVWSAELGERQHVWPNDLHTRGCVRRLAKALGIELKEGK